MATIQGVYVALFGRPADPTGLAYFNSVTKSGADLSAIGDLASTQEYKDRFAGQSNLAIVNSIYQSLFNRDAEATGLNFFVDALNKGTLNIKNIAIAILDGAQGTDKTIAANKITAADNFTKAIDTPVEIAAYTGNTAAAAGRAFLQPVNASISSIPTAAATDAALVTLTSTATGGVSITTDGSAAQAVSTTATDVKYKTTGGDDTITSSTTASTLKVDGGFGTDTLKVTTNGAWTPASGNIVNVEKLFVTAGGNHNVDLTNVTGLKEVWNENSAANVSAISNINAGATLGVKDTSGTVSFAFKDAATGTTSIALNKAAIGTSLTVTNGSDTVAVSVNGNSSVTSYIDASAKTVTISGTGDLTLTTAQADQTDATTAKAANISKVDASALAGKLTLDLSGTTKGVTLTGTNNADKIILDDVAGQKDVVIYNKAETSTYASFETVDKFRTADDKIDLKAFAFTKTGVTTITNLVDGASYGTSSVAEYEVGGNTFVFADSNGDGKINLATDFAVQLVGVTAANFSETNLILS